MFPKVKIQCDIPYLHPKPAFWYWRGPITRMVCSPSFQELCTSFFAYFSSYPLVSSCDSYQPPVISLVGKKMLKNIFSGLPDFVPQHGSYGCWLMSHPRPSIHCAVLFASVQVCIMIFNIREMIPNICPDVCLTLRQSSIISSVAPWLSHAKSIVSLLVCHIGLFIPYKPADLQYVI